MTTDHRRHVVVFDVNVYLDVADLLNEPFSWDAFNKAAAAAAREPVPHSDGAVDALRAIAVCMSGIFAGLETVEVFTNDHIEDLVHAKAMQPIVPPEGTDRRGLGWSHENADALLRDLVFTVTDRSNGGLVDSTVPDGDPPLDHEDGMVYGACKTLVGLDPLANVYCVTRDRGFLAAAAAGELSGHTKVLSPAQFVALVRAARASVSLRRIRPGGPSTT